MSEDSSNISMPHTPKEKYKHFAKSPSSIDLVEVSELTPMQCINMGISYCYDDDRYEDSFDEEFSSNCDTQPNSGNLNIINLNKLKEDFKEEKKDENNLIDNDNDNNKKISKISKLIHDL